MVNFDEMERIVTDALTSMPRLYQEGDSINVTRWTEDHPYCTIRYVSLTQFNDLRNSTRYKTILKIIPGGVEVEEGDLHVHPDFRRQGYGTELNNAREEILRRLGFKIAVLIEPRDTVVESSLPFWEAMGYRGEKGEYKKEL